jgi:hypothetical protein
MYQVRIQETVRVKKDIRIRERMREGKRGK